MVSAIVKEITLTDLLDDTPIETIYFGGGTPSLLSAAEIGLLMQTIFEKFPLAANPEITLEANPDDINAEKLAQWINIGINRLSIGVQSFNDAELRWMNRAHNAAESRACLAQVTAAGFKNYSVDLIYGSPMLSDKDLENNFEAIAHHAVPHISCYALTVEKGTALYRLVEKKQTPAADAGKQADQFELLLRLMAGAGYEQYEISNFSQPGFRSRHNSSYWQGKAYYGFGPSAHSFNGSHIRRWNVANNGLYLQSLEKNIIPSETELLSDDDRLNEYVMTSLRTAEGLDLGTVESNFSTEHAERILRDAQKYVDSGKAIHAGHFLLLSDKGKFFADGIAADLFI